MPRCLEITVPASQTDALVEELRHMDGLLNLRVWRGVSIEPPGDVVSLQVSNPMLHALMPLLESRGFGRQQGSGFVTSQPLSLVSSPPSERVTLDDNNATWEEMELRIGREAQMGVNGMLIMAAAGMVSVLGMATNSLHVVVGAMLLAPGFEPLLRVALGVVSGSGAPRWGLMHTARGYGALVAGAALAAGGFQLLSGQPLGATPAYLEAYVLMRYWSNITATSVVVSAVAGLAGALLIATNRSVLSTGVMAALALVPAASLVGVGLVQGDLALMGKGALRWSIDAALVFVTGMVVLGWKRRSVLRRRSMY